jgi:hypothetical protein
MRVREKRVWKIAENKTRHYTKEREHTQETYAPRAYLKAIGLQTNGEQALHSMRRHANREQVIVAEQLGVGGTH